MMTQPWPQIVARYEEYTGDVRSIQALGRLARQISESPLANGLFAWTSMFDLCIVQTPVSHPYNGPWLRIASISEHQIEFRYLDTFERTQQWHRTVDAEHAWPRFITFLDQLRWFPVDALDSLDRTLGGES